MDDRYEGRPLVRLLEYYFLWCIDELPPRDQHALEALAPKLAQVLGYQGSWYEILEAAVHLPRDIRARIASAWKTHVDNPTPDTPHRTPREAAEEFVDSNFEIEPATEPWHFDIH